mmetsp:Transcript_2853/g.6739  ORF Transcript_2853/g.6739 Transcript_2853/m.6739 type:complete len:637 (-) Transcript_2853:11-1921(-)
MSQQSENNIQPIVMNQDFFRNLDATIAGFGDGHVLLDKDNPALGDLTERDNIVEIQSGILKRFAPTGLEEPFKQLYSIIFPALFRSGGKTDETSKTLISSSSAAILMGVKGSGKTLLLERVLAACREQLQDHNIRGRLYRMVEVNGIVCRGEDVASVVYEIIRQLSGIAYRSIRTQKRKAPLSGGSNPDEKKGVGNGASTNGDDDKSKLDKNRVDDGDIVVHDDENDNDVNTRKRKRRKRKQRKIEKHMLRLRKATFNSNLALLESILKLAATDDVPILLNLDELDSFTDEGERQMLLYHFLDRVATPGSNLLLVGMTSSFSALTLLEKRIRSRAEGTAKIIYLRTPPTYEALLALLESKLEACGGLARQVLDKIPHPKHAETVAKALMETNSSNDESAESIIKLSNSMEREFRLGKDIRWFGRVVSTALALYRNDCVLEISRNTKEDSTAAPLSFLSKYLWNAMAMMGASVFDGNASRQPDLCVVDDEAVSPRLQALLDLSTPQVAVLLSARRILNREEHRDQAVLAPLTMERMLKEYESFRKGSKNRGNSKLLNRAVHHLLQQGLLVPSMDHSGGGPMHYNVTKYYRDLDPYTMTRLPLQLPIDIDRELGKALEQNRLECPTALKEWGKSISKG